MNTTTSFRKRNVVLFDFSKKDGQAPRIGQNYINELQILDNVHGE